MDLITNSYVVELALTVGKIMLVVGPLLIAVAYLTLAERRVIGFMQLRKGRMSSGLSACSSHLPTR